MNDRTDAVLASIDGALMDPEIPDGMRWSPEPEHVSDPDAMPYDGEIVPQPHQHYERTITADTLTITLGIDPSLPVSARNFPRVTTSRGGLRFGRQSHAEPPRAPLGRGISQAVHADLHTRAERVRAEARAMIPRVSDHTPTRALDTNPGLLIVEEYTNGVITVRRASPEETAEVVRRTWAQVVEAFRPLVEGVGEAFRQLGESFRSAGLMPEQVRHDLDTEEGRRAAALAHRRSLSTGPAPLAPERSRRPRTHR